MSKFPGIRFRFLLQDQEAGGYGGMSPDSFGDKAVRLGFIRKVYAILSAQLAVTLAIIGVFMIPSVQKFRSVTQHCQHCIETSVNQSW